MESPEQRRRTDGPPDAVVIAAVLAGDREQFGCLVTRYQHALLRHAVTMVLDHDVAADMVQDAFIRAYRHLSQCRDHSRFRYWLFQTLRRRCLDYLKEPRRQHLRLDDVGLVADDADGVGGFAARTELRGDLQRALAQLSVEQREAFVMHYVDGMPYDAMAEILDVSISALKMRTMRARETMATVLRGGVTAAPAVSSLYRVR
jgi:RNA polymerase sigma-70 factor (ECF subfamily)